MEINPSEVTKILKEQIKKFGDKAEVSEVGQVLSVGDGIARIYGLDNVQAGEMVEFSDGSKGMALNLERLSNCLCPWVSPHQPSFEIIVKNSAPFLVNSVTKDP